MEALTVVLTLLVVVLFGILFFILLYLKQIEKFVTKSFVAVEHIDGVFHGFNSVLRHNPLVMVQNLFEANTRQLVCLNTTCNEFFEHIENQLEHLVDSRLKQDIEEFGIFSVGFVDTPDFHRFCEAMDLHSKSAKNPITQRELLSMLVNSYITELSLDELKDFHKQS